MAEGRKDKEMGLQSLDDDDIVFLASATLHCSRYVSPSSDFSGELEKRAARGTCIADLEGERGLQEGVQIRHTKQPSSGVDACGADSSERVPKVVMAARWAKA